MKINEFKVLSTVATITTIFKKKKAVLCSNKATCKTLAYHMFLGVL